MSGYVYILTNPSFRDDWVKISKSSRPVDIRSKELDNTAVPLPFDIYAVMKTEKYNEAEKQIHDLIDIINPSMRIRKGREFFNVTPEAALQVFRKCAMTLDDAEITVIDEKKNHNIETNTDKDLDGITDNTQRRTRVVSKQKLTFSLLNIPVGTELTFVENSAIKAKVVDNRNTVELSDGEQYTISAATKVVKRKLGTNTSSEAYQGGAYWTHNGERLTTIRNRIESEN